MTKLDLIKENKEPAIAALNSYLDAIYNLTDKYFDDNGELYPFLPEDKKVLDFIEETRKDALKYEKVRRKLIDNDFNLSLYEINLIGLSFFHSFKTMATQIENLTKARNEIEKIWKQLLAKEEN